MISYFQLRRRYRQIYLLFFLISAAVVAFWGYELRQSMQALEEREEELLAKHQELLLERKGEQLRDVFDEIFQTTRTISLLPMVRAVNGPNRSAQSEDVVAAGRFSMDAHLTLQQIYTNLSEHVSVSEIYFVLDPFDPSRQVPFFMYDHLISGLSRSTTDQGADAPPEVEEDEYLQIANQLDWFRQHAPQFIWSRQLNEIPVRLSQVVRTCDNGQYVSTRDGDPRNAHGIIFAMPVYDLATSRFKGAVTVVLRLNVVEALLVGVPFIPVTPRDVETQRNAGWKMPPPASFVLRQPEYGVIVKDRRNIASVDPSGEQAGRWASISLDLSTGGAWELSHNLSQNEILGLTAPISAERRQVLFVRGLVLAFLFLGGLWNFFNIHRTRRELESMALFDSLTLLPNRRLFFDQLEHGIAWSKRHDQKLALLLVDINDFSAINDAYGTQSGDKVLAELGQRLQGALRSTDRVGILGQTLNADHGPVSRLGGDQFTVICEEMSDVSAINAVIERVQEASRKPYSVSGRAIDVKVSIGIAVFPDDASEGSKLLSCADGALQECRKEALPYFVFNADLRERSERLRRLSMALRRAQELGEYELFYQPKVRLSDNKVISLEALLRWRHQEMGLVSPTDFIPILERNGDIVDVGEWVIAQACRDLDRLREAGFEDIRISVNISVRQLRRGNLPEMVATLLERTKTHPSSLIFEVTESMMMENVELGRQALLKLSSLGIQLAIDDFGTGYSSLTYLQKLPLSYLKLDKAFIDEISQPRARHIVESVIRLANGLSLKTIAEGVETVEQRDLMAEMGCDIIQGYLFSKPIPLDDMVDWLKGSGPNPPRNPASA